MFVVQGRITCKCNSTQLYWLHFKSLGCIYRPACLDRQSSEGSWKKLERSPLKGSWNELATHRQGLCQRQSLPETLMD